MSQDIEPNSSSPITIEKPSDLPGSPMSAVIGFDQPCGFCGYNIRSLALVGACPECGAKINDAIRGSRMRYQPIGWIRRLRFGAGMAFWGVLGLMLVSIVWTVFATLDASSSNWWTPQWIWWTQLAVFVGSVEALAIGMILLSWSAPIRVRRKQLRAAVTRTSALCISISGPVMTMAGVHSYLSTNSNSAVVMTGIITWVLIVIGAPLLYFFGLSQISVVAGLIPWKKGQKRALVLQIYAPSAFVLWIVVYSVSSAVAMSWAMGSSQSGSAQGFGWIYFALIPAALLVLALIGMTMLAGLFFGLGRRIAEVAKEAIAARLPSSPAASGGGESAGDVEVFTGLGD